MVTKQIEKIMKDALVRFSGKEQTQPNQIQIMIHTKSEDLKPEYFYMIGWKPKVNEEDGSLYALSFNKDILDTKYDLLQREFLAANFLKNYFKTVAEELEVDAKEIYLMITSSDEEAKALRLGLYKNSEQVKPLTLGEVFGDEEEQMQLE